MVNYSYTDTPEGFSRWAVSQNWSKIYEAVFGGKIFQHWYTPSGLLIKRDWGVSEMEITKLEDLE